MLHYSGTLDTYFCDILPTLRSGQTFQWTDRHTKSFPTANSDIVYTTVSQFDSPTNEAEYIEIDLSNLEWTATFDARNHLYNRFRQSDKRQNMIQTLRDSDDRFDKIYSTTDENIHLVSDPLFPTLLSFICSSQMSIPRIHQMQQNLAHSYGSTIQIDNSPVPVYPTPAELAQTTEEELRSLKLGYRSRYIAETATDIYANLNQFTNIHTEESVTDAQSDLKSYLGVGEKVADCVLLYSLEFTQIIPIDTWMKKAGEQLYNWKNQSKKQIQSNFKNLWSPYGGLAQLYLFTYIQQNDIV